MNAQRDQGDWMMGGSADPRAHAVMGFTEAEAAQMVVEAYSYAADKVRDAEPGNKGAQFRAMVDLCFEMENLIAERLGLDPPESHSDQQH